MDTEQSKSFDAFKAQAVGIRLQQLFTTYETDRRLAELQWLQNLRQYLGIYDPDIEQNIGADRSRAYPRITRAKCISTVSRLMNLMFPGNEQNWSLAPSPVPNLPQDVLQGVLDQVMAQAQQAQQQGQQVDMNKLVRSGINAAAQSRAENMARVIADQLDELGGNKHTDYVALCRKVVDSAIRFGTGVLAGPFVETQVQDEWAMGTRGLAVTKVTQMRPRFGFVSIWDYYPDMSAKAWDQIDGQFQRHVMSRSQVRKLADRPDFDKKAVLTYLKNNLTGNYKRRTFETELKTLGVQSNINDSTGRKYEVLQYEGVMDYSDVKDSGIDLTGFSAGDVVPISAWFIDSNIIKLEVSPWVDLTGGQVNMYHQFVLEEDDTNIFGNGLPSTLRDSQMSISLAARMTMDNASITCAPNVVVDLAQLRPDQDLTTIHPYKLWYRDENARDTNRPAVQELQFNSHIPELSSIMNTFMQFADVESFVNPATGGDMSRGPSEPFRTATGASILRGDAALPFRDVVRNFDVFTQSVIGSMVVFNQHFNDDPSIQGDYQTIARGAMSLVAKEVRGIQLDSYVQSLRPEEAAYVNWYELAKERAKVRDLDADLVLVDRDTAAASDQQRAQAAQQQSATQNAMMQATIRDTVSGAIKNLSQADKNKANANQQMMKTMLQGVEHGIQPDEAASIASASGSISSPQQSGTQGGVDPTQPVPQ